ncbi:MAG: LysR family transcriptional regulator, partial [Candidatus Omnitrophica bacterium]|nr:LysR family transcriptional regulator [Candidatus Omnitrophota bacterium]
MIPFNYHHLYYFYVIAQEGSISRATEILNLAQPTLSAQLKQFEDFLNVKLFIREGRKLTLTEEGRKVLSYAKMIFDIGQELKDRMVDLSHKGRPHIHIGIGHFVPKTIVDLLLHFILEHEPNTYIHVEKDNMDKLIQDLNDHILDLVLTDTPFETTMSGDIKNKFIGKIPIVFCAHPTIARHIKQFPKDITGQPMIFPAAPRQIAYTLKEFLYEHQLEPKIVGEIQDIETVRRLALRGYGIAALNLLTVKEAPAKENLTIL